MRHAGYLAIGILGLILVRAGHAADPIDYENEVKPLLSHKCGACHGVLKQEGGLRLDAGRLIHQGGESGTVVVPGDASDSLIMERVSADDPSERMPPEGEGERLSREQLAVLRAWINSGAQVPADEPIPVGPAEHWAYQQPIRQTVPAVEAAEWSHPIDAFIAREHRRLGLQAVDLADGFTLFRRLSFDLVGLPPSRAELLAFVDDRSPDAWRVAIDSFLDSPHYGERWGRHWMDVWRYSDWDGYKQEVRGSQRHIWHWRDWIIESLNSDKGYDQMIVEMLAADEVAPHDQSALAATGFLARNYHKSNRNIWLDATVEHTAKAFLGLTISCARCHDHKYDPIPQVAYYQFRAIFEPHQVRTDHVPGQTDIAKDGVPRAFDSDLSSATYVYLQGNDKHPDKDNPVEPSTPQVLGGLFDVQEIDLPPAAFQPELQEFVQRDRLTAAQDKLAKAEAAIASAAPEADHELLRRQRTVAQLSLYSLRNRYAADDAKLAGQNATSVQRQATLAGLVERQLNLVQAELAVYQQQLAVDSAKTAEEAEDKAKKAKALAAATKKLTDTEKARDKARERLNETPDDKYTPVGKEYPHQSSGRRTALARWITDRRNPLTARVAVNQVWMRHFGTPLVENVFDFGLRSPRPRHADLLDWLAVELMENDWSLKHLHRLILTSRTWRMASSGGADLVHANQAIDQDNHYLWRTSPRRLDAEIIRDNVLAVSGSLDESFGGPDIDFLEGETTRRRSIYIRHAYEKQMTMLVLFDAASPNECYRRSESIVPQQALAMTNSSLSLGRSRTLAAKLWSAASVTSAGARERFIESAFLQILSRYPTEEEQQTCGDFLEQQSATLEHTESLTTFVGGSEPEVRPAEDPVHRARENLVQVLMNHNDFFTVR